MPNRIYAGSSTIKLVFLKVKTGFEKQVFDDLITKLHSADIKYYKIYKVFGKFDLLLIYQSGRKSLLYTGLIPYVVYSEGFDCFTWKTLAGEDNEFVESFDFGRLTTPLLGMLFSKTKPQFFKDHGNEIDLSLTEHLNDNKTMLLGGFGWSDAIILLPDASIVNLEAKLNNFANLQIESNKRISRLSSETFSIVCIDFEYCEKLITQYGEVPEIINDSMSNVFAELLIIYKPEHEREVLSSAQKKFKCKAHFSLERHEIILSVHKLGWNEFIRDLLVFRLDNSEKLCETYVNIATKKKLKSAKVAAIVADDVDLICIDKYLESLSTDDFGAKVLTLLYFINHYSLDNSVSNAFLSIRKFLSKLLEKYLPNLKRDHLSNLLDLVKIGAMQRISGSDIFKKDAFVTFYDHKGGIQKILSAIEILPTSILGQLNIEWSGFVVVGSAPDYRHDMDIINIPSKATLNPTEWWGVFHETGHIYCLHDDQFCDQILRDFAKTCLDLNSLESDAQDLGAGGKLGTIIRNYVEIVADSFDLRFCFLGDEDLYINTIWSYLFSEHKNRLYTDLNGYILRTVSCIIINDIISDKYDDTAYDNDTVERIISKLNNICNDVAIWDTLDIKGISYSILRNKPFLLHVSKALKSRTDMYDNLSEYYVSDEFKKVCNFINDGSVYYKKIKYPHLLILHMLHSEKVTEKCFELSSRVAAIKSLWYQSLFKQ